MKRFAVYYAPRQGEFAAHATAWLGWDPEAGREVAQPDLPGLPAPAAELTRDPRKYGFHGTLRAPFRLDEGVSPDDVRATVDNLAAQLAPVTCDALRIQDVHGFLALIPQGCEDALQSLAAAVVEGTDHLRAPLTDEEIARRKPDQLSPRQQELLHRWGYPYVMEQFQFHLTLTDKLPEDRRGPVTAVLQDHLSPVLPRPFVIEDLCLFGEDRDGRFHLLHRAALSG
jgi:putative phosphonate metabolism protein